MKRRQIGKSDSNVDRKKPDDRCSTEPDYQAKHSLIMNTNAVRMLEMTIVQTENSQFVMKRELDWRIGH